MVAPTLMPSKADASIRGLYTHFIGGRPVHPDGQPDLVRHNPAASNQALGGLRSADLALVKTPVPPAPRARPPRPNTAAPRRGHGLPHAPPLMGPDREH